MEDDDFRRFFRMNKNTLKALVNFLKPERRCYQGGRVQIEPSKSVAVTTSYLGSQMPCKQLGNMFGISEGCLIKVTNYIMSLLKEKSKLVIKWPNKQDYEDIANEFNKRRIRYICMIFSFEIEYLIIVTSCCNEVFFEENFQMSSGLLMDATLEYRQGRMNGWPTTILSTSTVYICRQYVCTIDVSRTFLSGKYK